MVAYRSDTKKCKTCKKVLPVTEFYTRDDTSDGLFSECKPCRRAYDKQWRADNREKCREYERRRGEQRRSYRPHA